MIRATRLGEQRKPTAHGERHHLLAEANFSNRSFERAVRLLKAIGDEGRLRLMEILSRQEACVGDLAETMNEQISTISERLRRLRDAGLVTSRRQGKHRFYSVADRHITELVLNALSHATEDEREIRKSLGPKDPIIRRKVI